MTSLLCDVLPSLKALASGVIVLDAPRRVSDSNSAFALTPQGKNTVLAVSVVATFTLGTSPSNPCLSCEGAPHWTPTGISLLVKAIVQSNLNPL